MSEWANRVHLGSCERMAEIPDASVHCCVTSPPYFGLRVYGEVWTGGSGDCDHKRRADARVESSTLGGGKSNSGHQREGWPGGKCGRCGARTEAIPFGNEATVAEYVERMVGVFREVQRVLRDDGTAWLNLGDSYAGSWGAQGRTDATTGRSVMSSSQIATHPHNASHTGSIRDKGLKPKDLIGIPWRIAFALQSDGWWLRDAIVWAKSNPMPSSVTDRCTSSYEMVFMLAKSKTYYANMDAVREPLAEATLERINQAKWKSGEQARSARANGGAKTNGPMRAVVRPNGPKPPSQIEDNPNAYNTAGANRRNVWTIATTPYTGGDHPAVMPRQLATDCILIGSPPGGIVLDPFMGSGTVAECAIGNGRRYVGYEINPDYHAEIARRLGLFGAA